MRRVKIRDEGNFVNVLLDTMENAIHVRRTDMIEIEHRITTGRRIGVEFALLFPELYGSY